MEIRITARSIYGQVKFYPANHEAKCLAQIAGTTTLTFDALATAARMGMSILIDGDKTLADMCGHLRAQITDIALAQQSRRAA